MDTVFERAISPDLLGAYSPPHEQTAPSYLQLATFLFFGDKRTRPLGRSDTRGIAFRDHRRSKWSARYERLEDEIIPRKRSRLRLRKIIPRRKRTKARDVKLGGAKKAWRFRIFRVRLRWVSPRLLLKRLRDAYVNMMIKIANSSYIADLAMAYPSSYALSPF